MLIDKDRSSTQRLREKRWCPYPYRVSIHLSGKKAGDTLIESFEHDMNSAQVLLS